MTRFHSSFYIFIYSAASKIEVGEKRMLYAVYLQDTNGHRRLVGGGMDLMEKQADDLIKSIEAKHTKPHKVDYFKIGYEVATKLEILAEARIEY